MKLVTRFADHVASRRLLPPGARVVVACSGGGDSVALLHLVARTASALALARVSVAHLDHGLRAESQAEAATVRALAKALRLSCFGDRRSVVARPGESPEEAARCVRFAFLADAAMAADASHVLTAHHMDDQAETVLQRILRGTGIAGLAGIPEERSLVPSVSLVRPLLPFRRHELRAWLVQHGLAWSDDPSNADGSNLRARLRTQALPVLAACVGRDPVPLLSRLATNAAEFVNDTPSEADAVAASFVRADPVTGDIELASGFRRLPRSAIAAALRRLAPGLRHDRVLSRAETERLLAAVIDGSPGDAVTGIEVTHQSSPRTESRARLTRHAPAPPPPEPVAVVPDIETELWDGMALHVALLPATTPAFLRRLRVTDGTLELADATALVGPLSARVRQPGDRLRALGAAASVRLGHLLQRRGVAASERARLPLVCDADGIVWAAGSALAHRVRVSEQTTTVAVLRLIRR